MGEYDRAIADFDASIRLDPASAWTFNNRGSAWYFKGDRDRARRRDGGDGRTPGTVHLWVHAGTGGLLFRVPLKGMSENRSGGLNAFETVHGERTR
jgi:tetratricopeptide (TPR) repeat protein